MRNRQRRALGIVLDRRDVQSNMWLQIEQEKTRDCFHSESRGGLVRERYPWRVFVLPQFNRLIRKAELSCAGKNPLTPTLFPRGERETASPGYRKRDSQLAALFHERVLWSGQFAFCAAINSFQWTLLPADQPSLVFPIRGEIKV